MEQSVEQSVVHPEHLVVAVEARENWKSFRLRVMVKALLMRQTYHCAIVFGQDRGLVRLRGRYTGFATETSNG